MVKYKIENKIKPIALEAIKLSGSVSEQMEKFFYHRIFSDYARGAVFGETENAFRTKIDDATPAGLWQGEFWGKWVIGAAKVCRYKKDRQLREFLRVAAHNLLALQREDGYIGTYADSSNLLAADPEVVRAALGTPWNWNWNMWCRKYTLWGLIEIYLLTGDGDILLGARRFADQTIGELRSLGYHLVDVGTFVGLPAGSILKPMLKLYRITGDGKYLDFCLSEAALWEREDGSAPNLISNLLAGKPIHTWYEKPEEWAKAYELMSCLEGIAELYRITGDEKYLTVCKNAHELIKKYEYNAIFGVTCNDMFYGAAEYQNSSTEPCDTIHWMRLCYELYTLTGDPKYMDDIEESFYNPFLAASFEDGKWGARAVRSSGRHMVVHIQAKMKESHCCVNNMPRGYMRFAEGALARSDKAAYLNAFTELCGKLTVPGGTLSVTVGGSYLEDGRVTVAVSSDTDTTLAVRIPYWSEKTILTVGEKAYAPSPRSYFELPIKKGETRIDIAFDMTPRIVDFSGEAVNPKKTDYAVNRFISEYIKRTVVPFEEMFFGRRSRLLYGPLILARSKKCGNTEEKMFSEKTVAGGGYKAMVTPIKPNGTRVKYRVRFENESDSFETVMCDFATGSNEHITCDSKLFCIWI